jgi:hypothetical protein
MQTILFFSPYTPWLPHTLPEVTMGHALRQRGHSVRFLTCSGLPNCGMAPTPMENREAMCENCRYYTQNILPQTRHIGQYFQDIVTSEEKARIAEWAEGLGADELENACYAGLPLGQWMRADMISHWGHLQPRLEREEVQTYYRQLLVGAAIAAVAFPRLYDHYAPDALVTLNGTFFLHRVAVEVARARGIRVIVHERGWIDNTLQFFTTGVDGSMAGYQERWAAWKDVPLTRAELQAITDLLQQRRQGVNMNWAAFSPVPQGTTHRAQVCADLGLPDRPLALLCTSSDCEGSLADRIRAMNQFDWIEQTVAWFAEHSEYALAIRVHPNEDTYAKKDDRVLQWYLALRERLPDNVALILPHEKVSTYSLMDVAAAGLSYGSTAGLEMACLGLPLVHAGMGYYKDCGFTHEIGSASDIPAVMARVMGMERDPHTQRQAYRFLQRLFLDICLPFDKVKISSNHFQAELNYQSVAELSPGRDKNLDRITECILGSAPLFPAPTPAELARTTDQEDAFFNAFVNPLQHAEAAEK